MVTGTTGVPPKGTRAEGQGTPLCYLLSVSSSSYVVTSVVISRPEAQSAFAPVASASLGRARSCMNADPASFRLPLETVDKIADFVELEDRAGWHRATGHLSDAEALDRNQRRIDRIEQRLCRGRLSELGLFRGDFWRRDFLDIAWISLGCPLARP